MPELLQLFVEGLERLGALAQEIVDQGLPALLDRLFFLKEFFDVVGWLFFPHADFSF